MPIINVYICLCVCECKCKCLEWLQSGAVDGLSTRKSISCKLKRRKDYRRLCPCVNETIRIRNVVCVPACLPPCLFVFFSLNFWGKKCQQNYRIYTMWHTCVPARIQTNTRRTKSQRMYEWCFASGQNTSTGFSDCFECMHARVCGCMCVRARLYVCYGIGCMRTCALVFVSVCWLCASERQSNRIISHRHSVVKMASHRSH